MGEYVVIRSDIEINEVLNICFEREESGKSSLWAMGYEQGVVAAIRWLTDTYFENPVKE